MGVCINYKAAQEVGYAKQTLDHAHALAKEMQTAARAAGLEIQINREDDLSLLVDVDGCETLAFEFKPFPAKPERDDFYSRSWEYECLKEYKHIDDSRTGEHYDRWPNQRLVWLVGFCKTQYAPALIAHRLVAELVRAVCGRSVFAMVNDEGDYYHTGDIEDAAKAIESNGEMINALGGMLASMAAGTDIIKGGETKIKARKKKEDRNA